jgi:hypothetical protein
VPQSDPQNAEIVNDYRDDRSGLMAPHHGSI